MAAAEVGVSNINVAAAVRDYYIDPRIDYRTIRYVRLRCEAKMWPLTLA